MLREKNEFLKIDDAFISVSRFGPRDRDKICLLHGGLGSMEDFSPLLPFLKEYDCLAIDTRGHGASTSEDKILRYPQLAADAEAVLNHYDFNDFIIIGFSDGGITGLHLAIRDKVKIKGLVTIGTHCFAPEGKEYEIMSSVNEDFWRKRFPDTVELYEKINPQPNLGKLVSEVRNMWLRGDDNNYPGDAIKNITIPTLCIGGYNDHLASPATTLEVASKIPNASAAIIPFAGHATHAEQPEMVGQVMLDFIGRS